jgi:hypothetical protein
VLKNPHCVPRRRACAAAIVTYLALVVLLASCQASSPAAPTTQAETEAPYAGAKILFVDSYHQGYEWSDGIEAGIQQVLQDTGVELAVVHMDTKRNPDEAFKVSAAQRAKAEIASFDPDVVIAADDNAQQYLIAPYFKDTDLPVVFCGVNWDASIYGYPTRNVTGMVEVELVERLVGHLKIYADGKRVGYVTVDSATERKAAQAYNERFFDHEMAEYWVRTWDEFKEAYLQAQDEVDIVLLGTNAGIDRWDPDEAERFFVEHTTVPTGAVYDWLAPYALITLAKNANEQGEWAAESALRILDGAAPSSIAITQNQKGILVLNLNLAEQLDVVFMPSMLRNAQVYGYSRG